MPRTYAPWSPVSRISKHAEVLSQGFPCAKGLRAEDLTCANDFCAMEPCEERKASRSWHCAENSSLAMDLTEDFLSPWTLLRHGLNHVGDDLDFIDQAHGLHF